MNMHDRNKRKTMVRVSARQQKLPCEQQTLTVSAKHAFVPTTHTPRGGGGVLPSMGYIGLCGPKGYGFSAVLVINVFGQHFSQVNQRIARKWHKPVQNAILWANMQKRKIMLDFRLFAVKSMKFSLTRFSKLQLYIYISEYVMNCDLRHGSQFITLFKPWGSKVPP